MLNKRKYSKTVHGTCTRVFSPESKQCMIKWDVDGNLNQELISHFTNKNADCNACLGSEASTDRKKNTSDIYFLCYSDKNIFNTERTTLHGQDMKQSLLLVP